MKAVESRAEIYLMAIQSLPKAEKEAGHHPFVGSPLAQGRYSRFSHYQGAARGTVQAYYRIPG